MKNTSMTEIQENGSWSGDKLGREQHKIPFGVEGCKLGKLTQEEKQKEQNIHNITKNDYWKKHGGVHENYEQKEIMKGPPLKSFKVVCVKQS